MNDEKYKDTLQACFYGDKGAYNQCMYEFQHRGLINNQLQSNWNSLREDIQHKKDILDKDQAYRFNHETKFKLDILNYVLDKMNELEGKNKE